MATDTFSGSGNLTSPWTVVTGTFNQSGGTCYAAQNSASSYAVNTTDGVLSDQYAEVTMNPSGGGHFIGPAVRGSNAAFTCANVDAGSDGVYVSRWTAGVQTVIAGPLSAPAAGTVIRLSATGSGSGNALRLYFDGVEQTGSGSPWTVGTNIPDTGYTGLTGYHTGSGTGATDWTGAAIITATAEQEGFRFGLDDGDEASHTWAQAQDTNHTANIGATVLARLLINGTDDLASAAYTLRYQKNGSGGYTAVPVGSTTQITPSPTASDATESGNNTASSSWSTFAVPNASTGDLLIFCLSWDDSTTTTGVTAPSGQNGETLTAINSTPATDSGTETRSKVWYCKATGSWTAGTITFTPSASEQWTGACIRIPAGQFDASTPIGASGTRGASGTAEANIQHAAFSAGGSDGGGKLLVWTSSDDDPQTAASGFTQVCNTDRGAIVGGLFKRDTAVSNSESFSVTTVSTIASDSWSTVAFVVRGTTQTNEIYVTTSSNIASGGEATTARLTAPSGKSTSDFVTGRRWDDENGTDTIDITDDDYTEVEWCLTTQSPAASSDYYDLRVYSGSNALDTYTVTPRLTMGSAVSVSGSAMTGGAGTQSPGISVGL